MSGNDESIQKVKEDFIFNDDVQNILSDINSNLMDFNILEITGMGHQEIKHSNILGWLFEDSEHNLQYQILDGFLKKVIEENTIEDIDKKILDNLQSYIYLPENKKDITIYREKDNIDLLIVDEVNKVVISIENKVYADERKDTEDIIGQLGKYEIIIDAKYKSKELDKEDGYDKYFIFLTINSEEPSRRKWMKGNHQMVTDVIEEILNTKKDIVTKTKIIFESYVDLLKRNGIVADDKLKELCEKIWDNKEYREAFEIIANNRPSKIDVLKNILEDCKELKIIKQNETGGSCTFVIEFNEESPLRYIIQYSTNNRVVKFSIVSNDIGGEIQINNTKFTFNNVTRHDYKFTTRYIEICSEDDLVKKKHKLIIWLDEAKKIDTREFVNNANSPD